MSLPNLSSGNTSGDSDLMGRSLRDGDESGSSSSAEEPVFRARSDFESDSGLDGFASEENDSDASWRPLAQPARTSEGDAARPAASVRTEHEPAPDRRPRANVVSLASRGRAKIGTVVPRLIHTARLDRIGSTVALVGQTGARVTHSLSATLTRPRRRIDYRLAGLLLLSVIAFAELWWVTHRLSNPAQSLAQSESPVPPAPVVTESLEELLSRDSKASEPVRVRVTFRSMAPTGPNVDRLAPSWVAVSAPMPVEIYERGQQLGTSWSGGMKLAPGPHDLRIVNRSVGIDLQKSVEIVGGGMASLTIDFPPGVLQINALPWATVSVDGVAMGKTPLAKIELTPGRHDVVFSHPRFGQKRTTVTVKSGKPLRLGMDMRRRGR